MRGPPRDTAAKPTVPTLVRRACNRGASDRAGLEKARSKRLIGYQPGLHRAKRRAARGPLWVGPLWVGPLWLGPLWLGPLWLGPLWLGPLWLGPLWLWAIRSR
jgi:hypothetical protein